MNKLPKILIKFDKKQEIKLFLKFLNHPEFPQHRQMIFQALPELKELLVDSKKEKAIVTKFIDKFYLKHKKNIALANKDIRQEIKSSSRAIKALGEAMDYKWKDSDYTAIPTMLPFSPFNKNIFRFSILDRIMGIGKKNILETSIHEISHFIFFEFLKKIEKKEKFSLNQGARYYLKETITTALFNEEPLKSVFKIENYKGNPDIRDIYIMDKDKSVKTFIEYTREQYLKNKKDFIAELVVTTNKVSSEFSKKRSIWNKNGKELFKNESALSEYRKPIELN